MSNLILSLLLTFLILGCQTDNNKIAKADKKKIESTLEKYIQAIRDQNIKGLANSYDLNGIRLAPYEEAIIGRKSISEIIPMDKGSINKLTFETKEIRGEGKYAHWWGTFYLEIKVENSILRRNGKWLAVMKKQDDGSWLVDADVWNSSPDPDEI